MVRYTYVPVVTGADICIVFSLCDYKSNVGTVRVTSAWQEAGISNFFLALAAAHLGILLHGR